MEDHNSCEIEINRLKEENKRLKEIIAVALNKTLIKKLSDALERINSGKYITEEEFFNN